MTVNEENEGWCPEHGWQYPAVRHEGRKFYYVCPICGDDLLPYADTPALDRGNDGEHRE